MWPKALRNYLKAMNEGNHPLVDRYDLLSQAFLNLNLNPYLLSGKFTSPLGIER